MYKEKIQKALKNSMAKLNISYDDDIHLEKPLEEAHGDYASNIAFALSRSYKKTPMEIAKLIIENFPKQSFISEIKIYKPGFINFYLDTKQLTKDTLEKIMQDTLTPPHLGNNEKVIVEHTSVNPNKAMHIGHLRNAILGDSIARLLKKCGFKVEVQNYINDAGAQVADTTLAILYLNEKQPKGQSFDEFCWDMYSKINKLYKSNPKLLEKRREIIKRIEEGGNPIAQKAKEISIKNLECHLNLLAKLGIFYNLLVFETDTLRFKFWETAFEQLKQSPNFVYKNKGEQKGCWVLKYGGGRGKIFVRSNGTAVYTAKDTAYHMWKFGLLKRDFLYKKWPKSDITWMTSVNGIRKRTFGHGRKIINVIDERQVYPQNAVKLALKTLGYETQAQNYYHLAYGVVMLSHQTAKSLGLNTLHKKGSYAMSGREGIGVKASDLIKLLIKEIEKKSLKDKDIPLKQKASTLDIASAAIRHYMLKYSASSQINFDYEQALNLYGNTGPYLQYSHARASSILRKARNFKMVSSKGKRLTYEEEKLIKLLSIWPEVVERACKELSLSQIARYAFDLSSRFHRFYEQNQVLKAEEDVKNFRLTLVAAYKRIISDVLSVLGIFPPERM